MELTPQIIQDLNLQANQLFQNAFSGYVQQWDKKATEIPSSAYANVYPWIADLPRMREWIGDRNVRNLKARVYRLDNKSYEFTVGINRDDIKYDQLGLFSIQSASAGQAAALWRDDLVTDAQKKGITAICWDGQYFYDTDHPVVIDDAGAGTYANYAANKPLTVDNVWDVMATMMAYKGENGKSMQIVPNILEVAPQNGKKAKEICEGDTYVEAVLNGATPVGGAPKQNPLKGLLTPIINPELSDQPDYWYVHCTTKPVKPFLMQVAEAPGSLISRVDPSLDNVFYRKEFEFGTEAFGAAGYGMPFLSFCAKVTA